MPLKDPIARRAYQKQWERKQPPRVRVYSESQRTRQRELARIRRANGYRSLWHKSERGRKRSSENARRWRSANPEKVRATNRACYLRNLEKRPDCYREYAKAWGVKHPQRAKEIDRKSYLKHRDSRCKRARQWRKRNPVLVLAFGHARRARKRAAVIENCVSKIAILKKSRFCHWCCTSLTPKTVTIDHVVPLARGGKHCNDNLVAACLSCNTSKNDNLVHEWTWTEAA